MKRRLRSAAFLAWMSVLLPGSVVASWEVPATDIDARARVMLRSGPRSDQVQRFGYDLAGNVTREEWANGRVLTHSYDELNRRKASVDVLGAVGAWGYDDDGHLLSETDGCPMPTISSHRRPAFELFF